MATTLYAIFNNEKANYQSQLFMAFGFLLFTILALGIDSVGFLQNYFDGRTLTNFLAISYFALFYYFADSHLRKLMFVMVPLSYLGEIIFCKGLGFYAYRTDAIPLYVPFGHAIVYASGYVFAHTNWAIKNENTLRKFFAIGFIVLFLGVGFLRNDWFSLVFGVFFFLLLKRKRWQNLYYFIALCVIYIELFGTYFQCWAWVPKTFDAIPTANPPMGAVFFYAGGDVLLAKIVELWQRNKVKPIPS
ncbi:MAG: hypothetical protein EOO46_02005 [Flavobacterium sp.]|nr:MAG: hypothetical protein EOO46_02005 [Flavobacterium sp.]